LVGTQKDRETEREVSREIAERFMKDNKLQYFLETSAKIGTNVDELIGMAAKMLFKKN